MAEEDRGFASMDPEKQREISRKGGEASGGSRESEK
ncbi:MAG TPA: KGG domain-containing protein [Verrucomicrobiae bacterium]|nr:KGG domain-containing protein [Verrucomicrobiae bacterium]